MGFTCKLGVAGCEIDRIGVWVKISLEDMVPQVLVHVFTRVPVCGMEENT